MFCTPCHVMSYMSCVQWDTESQDYSKCGVRHFGFEQTIVHIWNWLINAVALKRSFKRSLVHTLIQGSIHKILVAKDRPQGGQSRSALEKFIAAPKGNQNMAASKSIWSQHLNIARWSKWCWRYYVAFSCHTSLSLHLPNFICIKYL